MKKKLALLFVIICFIICTFMYFMSNSSLLQIQGEGVKTGKVLVLNKNVDIATNEDVMDIKIPNNCFYKKANLKIKVNDGSKIKIKFSSPNVSETKSTGIFGKIKPKRKFIDNRRIYVLYKNIKINGKSLSSQNSTPQKAIYAKNIKPNSKNIINLSFNHRLVPDYRLDIQSHVYLLLLVLFLAFLSQKYKDKDWLQCVIDSYKSIDPVYRKSFWIIFIVTNIVFSFHTFQMLFGNHAWDKVILTSVDYNTYFHMGRYTSTIFKVLFLNGELVPLLTNIITFTAVSLTGLLLCKYWNFKKSVYVYTICGLIFAIQPFFVEWLFHIESQPELAIAPVLVLLGLLFAQAAYDSKNAQNVLFNLTAVVLINFAVAVYPTIMTFVVVAFVGKLFSEFLNCTKLNLIKNILKRNVYCFIDIILAFCLFKAITLWLTKLNIIEGHYTISQLPLIQMPSRILTCVNASIEQLYNYNLPFIPNCITEIFTILLILLIGLIIFNHKQDVKIKLLQLLLLFITLVSTQFALMICSSDLFFLARMDYYGILVFRVLIVGVLLTYEGNINIKNITIVLSCVALSVSIVNDLLSMKAWYLDYNAELMHWNRLKMRLEFNKDFKPDVQYNVIQVGRNMSYRTRFVQIPLKTSISQAQYTFSVVPDSAPFMATEMVLEGNSFIKKYFARWNGITSGILNAADEAVFVKLYKTGIMHKALYSDENLFVTDDIILYVTNKKELKTLIDETEQMLTKGKIK